MIHPYSLLPKSKPMDGFRSEETGLSKARGIPLACDQGCLLPLPQAQCPADVLQGAALSQQQSCPRVPGTAARTPGQSRQSTHSASGTLGCGAPPAPAAQAQGNTSHQENHHLSKWRLKSSTKSLGSWCYTHTFNRRFPTGPITCGMGQKEKEKHFSPHLRHQTTGRCSWLTRSQTLFLS